MSSFINVAMDPSYAEEDILNDAGIPAGKPYVPYRIRYGNWYKTIPYALRIISTESGNTDSEVTSYYFPVNPEGLNISTPFATVVTPTLGAIVQEHSGPVFYNITINGTTGVIPALNYFDGKPLDPTDLARPLAANTPTVDPEALGGFGTNTINAINSIVSTVTGVKSKLADGTLNPYTGYTAFHVLYKMLWWYHFAKAQASQQQLVFTNYKDCCEYHCVVQNFALTRDKGSPHLYRYSIQLKAWNLSQADKFPAMSKDDLATYMASLGIFNGPSTKALAFRVITEAKSVLNGAKGLLQAGASDFAV